MYNILINKWGNSCKGKGVIHCVKPMSYSELIKRVILLMRNKNPTVKVLIVVGKWAYRKEITDYLKDVSVGKLDCITHDYINGKYRYSYDVVFIVGVNEWTISTNTVVTQNRFSLMLLTADVISNDKLSEISKHLPTVNANLSSEDINNIRTNTPVEEMQVGVNFVDKEDVDLYNKYTQYITQAIKVFGDFPTIGAARKGSPDGRSAQQVLNDIAEYNGWSAEMDMSNPFNAQIDKCYNPIVLSEMASTCYDIIRKRAVLVNSNVAKLNVILNLINDNPNKQFVIISKRGEFAASITDYINKNIGNVCGDYHDKIDKRILVDDNGVPVLYKSGAKKGEPRIVGSRFISSSNLRLYNDKRLRVLSIKNSSDSALKCVTDAIIITSSLCDSVNELKYKFNNIVSNDNKVKVYKLYMIDTIEQNRLNKEVSSELHTIIRDNENVSFSNENFDDIICD